MKRVINYLLFILYLLNIVCSIDPTAGSGSDLPDMKIAVGMIYNSDSSPAHQVQVRLIPAEYNSIKDGPLLDSHTDTTDDSGIYSFILSDTGEFNVQAVHLITRTRALITDIQLRDDDTIFIPQGVLKKAGALQVILPDTVDTVNGYLYIKGTTASKVLASAVPLTEREYSVTIDSLPESILPSIHYGKLNSPQKPIPISDTIIVFSNDTAITETFIFWAHYKKDNTDLPHNTVKDLCLDSDGSLWFGTHNGVAKFDGSEWAVYNTYNSGLVYNNVIEISKDVDGILWFATSEGAASFDGKKWVSYTTGNSDLPNRFVTSIQKDRKGKTWFSTCGGIAKFDGNNWVVYNAGNSELLSDTITYLTIDNADNIWFSSYYGAGMFDGKTWTIYKPSNSGMPIKQVFRVEIDSRGNKWFGHCWGVVSMFDGTKWNIFNLNNSAVLQDGYIYDIMEDTDGNIWIGSEYGLTKFDGQKWTDFCGERYKLLDKQVVYSIIIDEENNKWVGTSKNGVIVFGPTIK